jgi:HSP20 family protein
MLATMTRPTTGSRRLSDLRNELDRFFDDMAGAASSGSNVSWRPSADILETANRYEIHLDLPGFDRDDIQVTVNEGVLTVEGRRTVAADEDGRTFHLRERATGRFSRSFSLPTSVNPENVEARFDGGVLRIDLPKEERARTRRVEVDVA